MSHRRATLSLRVGLMVAAAATLLLLIVLVSPNLIAHLASPAFMIATVFMVILSFLLALGVRKVADAILPGSSHPWYGRSGSGPLMLVSILVGGALTCLLGMSALAAAGMGAPPLAMALESAAFMLIWFLRLDWPTNARPSNDDDDEDLEEEDDDDEDIDRPKASRKPSVTRFVQGLLRR